MDPQAPTVIDNIARLAPLGTNAILMVAVVALWKKVNNGYYTALQALGEVLKADIALLRADMNKIEDNMLEILRQGGYERRQNPRNKA